jgi:hypothetical protein
MAGERYYLQLLTAVRGPTFFEDLGTGHGVLHISGCWHCSWAFAAY